MALGSLRSRSANMITVKQIRGIPVSARRYMHAEVPIPEREMRARTASQRWKRFEHSLLRSGAMEGLMDNAYSGLGLGNVTIVSSQPHLLSTCMASGDGEIAPCSVECTTVRVSIRPFRDAFAGICCIFSSLDRATSIPVRADSPLPLLDAVCSCVPRAEADVS